MNYNVMKDILGVLTKCLVILSVFVLVACDEKEATKPTPLVVQKCIKGSFEKKVEGLVIKAITKERGVILGRPQDSLRDCYYAVQFGHLAVYKLEGMAALGDRVVLVTYYEDQLLENGEARRVVTTTKVRSNNNQEIEKYFSKAPKVGENQPRTK